MATTEERLLVRLEADARKFVTEAAKLNDTIKTRMAAIDRDFQSANGKVVEGVRRKVQAFNDAGAGIGRYRYQVQNASYNVADFAVQVAGGTSAARAMAQQLPQLLGGLGMFGALAGAAAAIAIPLAANLFSAGESLAKIDAIPLDTVRSRISELTELQGKYTEALRVSAMVGTAEAEARVAQIGMEYEARLALFRLETVTLDQRRSQLENSIKAQRQEFDKLVADIAAVDLIPLTQMSAGNVSGIANPDAGLEDFVRTRQQSEALALVQEQIAANEEKANQIRREQAELDLVNVSLSEANGLLGGAVGLAGGLTGALGGAANNAAALADNMRLAVNAKNEYGKLQNTGGGGPDAVRSGAMKWSSPVSAPQPTGAGRAKVVSGSGRSAGGGGGRAVDPGQWLSDRMATAEAAVAAAQAEAASVGLVGQAAHEAKVKHEMLAEAKRRGLDLDKQSVKSGETLRAEIDRQAAAVADLTWRAEQYRARAQMMTEINEDLKNGFLDAVVAGKDLSGVLQNVAQMLAKAALEAALFGTGPFAGGGGGLFGGGIGNLFSGLFGGFREGGGDVSAGKAYVVGEKRPELFVPSSAGRIVPQIGGGGGKVDVRVSLSDDLDGRVIGISGAVSARQIGRAAKVQRRALPGALADARARGV